MSHLVNPIHCANFEDYDKYDEVSCTLETWPDMWPEEIAAEAGLREERRKFNAMAFIMARDRTWRTIQHFRTANHDSYRMDELVKRALRELADRHEWKVKNYDCVKHDFVSPIIRTSLRIDEDDSMDVDFDVVFHPKQKVKPKPRKIVNKGGRQNFVQAVLLQLIEENGWKKAAPIGYRGTITKPFKIT